MPQDARRPVLGPIPAPTEVDQRERESGSGRAGTRRSGPEGILAAAGRGLKGAVLAGRRLAAGIRQRARVLQATGLATGLPTNKAEVRDGEGMRTGAGAGALLRSAGSAVGAAASRVRALVAGGDGLAVPWPVEAAAVGALTLLAVGLRAWGLGDTPEGIHGDETGMALEALRSSKGESIGIWTGVTLGHPAGYAHWMGLLFRLGGPEVATMRLASALPGIAMIPVGYLLVRILFNFRVALITTALLTMSFWFVIQSRIAFGGVAGVFMAILAMALLVAAVQSRRWWVGAAAGVALGLGLYLFKTFLLYFAGIWAVSLLFMAVDRGLRGDRQLWLALGISLLVGAPMLWFYGTSGFIGPNLNDLYQVSLSSSSTWQRIPGLAMDALLLVHLPVEGNVTDGAPAIPILPLVATVPFWVGLAVSLLLVRERPYQLLLAGMAVGMLPVLFVRESRAVGTCWECSSYWQRSLSVRIRCCRHWPRGSSSNWRACWGMRGGGGSPWERRRPWQWSSWRCSRCRTWGNTSVGQAENRSGGFSTKNITVRWSF